MKSSNPERFLVPIFFLALPGFIEYYSKLQEAADFITAAATPGYWSHEEEIFDYIIIGAGTAGAVVANRLSKNSKNAVLVLEAGGDPNPFTSVPGLYELNFHQPTIAYAVKIVPQQLSCLELEGERCIFRGGKGLGGTSNVNTMTYLRGNAKNFDEWASITGDPVWSYKNTLEFFKKSEDYHGHYPLSEYHARGGGLFVGKGAPTGPSIRDYFVLAAKEMKLNNFDMNAGNGSREGYTYLDFNIKDGRRWGTYKGFVQPILGRKNLSIYRYARALKILFKQNHASRVRYIRHDGRKRYVRARKEIILCAGTVDSPKLLLLSGVGPKSHLASMGIKLVSDLPVGKGLQDHISVTLAFSVKTNGSLIYIPERDFTAADIVDYLQGLGPLAYPFYRPNFIAYISTKADEENPDLELTGKGGYEKVSNGRVKYQELLQQTIVLESPRSYGKISLRSKNPEDEPNINPNYLNHSSDISRLVEGIMYVLKMSQTNAFRELKAELFPNEAIPACKARSFRSREYWECYIRQKSASLYHHTRTCRMGRSTNDPHAVVDSKLRVLNTSGLRVIDSSVMPTIPTSHLQAATLMIAEMGSMFVQEDTYHNPDSKY